MKKNEGVIYIAIGSKFVKEALYSCSTFKKYNSNLHCTLYTNEKNVIGLFDEIVLINSNEHPWKLKVQIMLSSPTKKHYTLTPILKF